MFSKFRERTGCFASFAKELLTHRRSGPSRGIWSAAPEPCPCVRFYPRAMKHHRGDGQMARLPANSRASLTICFVRQSTAATYAFVFTINLRQYNSYLCLPFQGERAAFLVAAPFSVALVSLWQKSSAAPRPKLCVFHQNGHSSICCRVSQKDIGLDLNSLHLISNFQSPR